MQIHYTIHNLELKRIFGTDLVDVKCYIVTVSVRVENCALCDWLLMVDSRVCW